ncbi:MAG: hypothetical protein AB7G93_12360 [Bdellovibrionales bacterium]
MRFIRLSLVVCSFLVPIIAVASGGGEDKGAEDSTAVSKEQKEFMEKSAKLTTLSNRIADADRQFLEYVRQKEAAKTSEEKQNLIQVMVELNVQRNKDVDAHNKLKADLTYRYPKQGQALNRRYHTQSKKSIEELEGVAGLDELLTSTRKIIQKKFAPFMAEEDKEKIQAPRVAEPAGEPPKRLRLEK